MFALPMSWNICLMVTNCFENSALKALIRQLPNCCLLLKCVAGSSGSPESPGVAFSLIAQPWVSLKPLLFIYYRCIKLSHRLFICGFKSGFIGAVFIFSAHLWFSGLLVLFVCIFSVWMNCLCRVPRGDFQGRKGILTFGCQNPSFPRDINKATSRFWPCCLRQVWEIFGLLWGSFWSPWDLCVCQVHEVTQDMEIIQFLTFWSTLG